MPFLPLNQQHQSTEGISHVGINSHDVKQRLPEKHQLIHMGPYLKQMWHKDTLAYLISFHFFSNAFLWTIIRAVRKSRIHDRRDYLDFRRVPWFLAIAVISCHGHEYWRIIMQFQFLKGSYCLSFAVFFHFGHVPVMRHSMLETRLVVQNTV